MKKVIYYIIISLIAIGVGLGVIFVFPRIPELLDNILTNAFRETFNAGTIGGLIDKDTYESFQGERFWKQRGEYRNYQGNEIPGDLEGYDGGDIYVGDHSFSRLLEGENEWIDSEGYYHQREITDAQVFYHSKGLHNKNYEILSGEKIEKDDSLGVWVYSKGIYKDGKFEVIETHHYIIDDDCSKDGLDPICFQGIYDAGEYNRERIGEKCFIGHSCGLGSHVIEHLYAYEKLD